MTIYYLIFIIIMVLISVNWTFFAIFHGRGTIGQNRCIWKGDGSPSAQISGAMGHHPPTTIGVSAICVWWKHESLGYHVALFAW